MKIACLLLVFILYGFMGFSQAYETSVNYDKKKQKSIAIDYNYAAETVESAIERRIQKLGHLGKTEKGFFNRDKGYIVFNNAVISDISDDRRDYIVKVESGKSKGKSTLHLLIQKDGADAIPAMSSKEISKTKTFLANLQPDVEEAHLELQIKEQDEAVVKSEKQFKALQDEKAELEQKMQKNQLDLENIQKQIDGQRHSMDSLKGLRKLPSL